MAATISNTLLSRTNSANPLANAPTAPANPLAKPPAQTALTQAQNTGYGTNGAPMSVVPTALKSTPAPAPVAAKPAATAPVSTSSSVPPSPTSSQNGTVYNVPYTNPVTGQTNYYAGAASGAPQSNAGNPPPQIQPQQIQPPPQNTGVVGSSNGVASNAYSNTNPVTYPGAVNNLANAAQPNATQTGLVQNLAGVANSNPLQNGGAYEAYSKAVQNLNDLKQKIAMANSNIDQEAIPLNFQQGRKQVLSTQFASQLDAAQQAVNQAQAALGYGISEQQTQQSGLTSALGGANTQQAQTLSGLGAAAGYAQPQLGSYGQGYYNPLTANSSSNSPYGTGPAAAANVQSIQDHTKTINDWSASRQSATNIGNQLTSFLNANAVNPSDFNATNKLLQFIGQNTSSPQYKQFYNLVTDLANTYAPVLGQGDASNYKVQLAQSLLDGTASGQTIPQILAGLDAQAQTKIAGEQKIVHDLETGQNVNPEATKTSATSTGGNTIQTPYGNITPDL